MGKSHADYRSVPQVQDEIPGPQQIRRPKGPLHVVWLHDAVAVAREIQAKKQRAAAPAGRSGTPSGPAFAPPPPPPPTQATDELDIVDMIEDVPEPFGVPAPAAAAQDPPVLSCSHCEGLLYYDPNFANQTVACPHCGNHLIMPEL